MIKLETHCHGYGTSGCATTKNDLLIEKYLAAGYGAIILNNHHSKSCFEQCLKGENYKEKIDDFFRYFEVFKGDCAKVGIKVFLGTEVRVKDPRCSGTEYSVIGLKKKTYYENPIMFELYQKGLFELAEKDGAFMYQTHPFRQGVLAGNPKYLHGAECFNGHYHHINNNDLAKKFCEENNLIKLSGTDFHHEDQPITAGIYIPEDINSEEELVAYLFENKFTRIEDYRTYQVALKKYKGI